MLRRCAMFAASVIVAGGSLVATPAAAASAIQFHRIQYDSPGTDTGTNASLNAEYFQLRNVTTRTIDLYRWYVRDITGHVYRFASHYYLRPGQTVTVRTGKGRDIGLTRFWWKTGYVWNNTGDRAYLRTPSGVLADSCAWTTVAPGYKYC